MCNNYMMYYKRLLLYLFSYRCQLHCQDNNRGHVVPDSTAAILNSLHGHTCMPKNVAILLWYKFNAMSCLSASVRIPLTRSSLSFNGLELGLQLELEIKLKRAVQQIKNNNKSACFYIIYAHTNWNN